MMIITSQEHRDKETIEAKRAAKDYEVVLSPEFEIDGETYQVIIDGHHSFEAARLDGVEPEFRVATNADCDALGMIELGKIDEFLEAVYHGSDYRDARTGKFAF
jgi:hypothetical protein